MNKREKKMATGGGDFFSGFPMLKIDPKDVFGSWEGFLDQFGIEMEIKVVMGGTKRVGEEDIEIVDDKLKKLALLRAVGQEGQRVIQSKGYKVRNNTLTYEQALDILNKFYGREESIHVKTRNFVSVNQTVGEDNREYLKRVEQLSRNLQFFNNNEEAIHNALQTARENLALVIAVNGMRDLKLRKELMAKRDLNWEILNEILTSRSRAEESQEKLGKPPNNEVEIKKEVAETRLESQKGYDKREGGNREDRYRSRERNHSRDRYPTRYDSRDRRAQRWDSRDRNYNSYGSYNSRDRPREDKRYNSRDRNRENRRSNSRDRNYGGNRDSRTGDRSYKDNKGGGSGERKSCHECGSTYHIVRHCRDAKCYSCGGKGHIAMDCNQSRSRDHSREGHNEPNRSNNRPPSPYPGRHNSESQMEKINCRPMSLDENK